jgi:hypothetical protein
VFKKLTSFCAVTLISLSANAAVFYVDTNAADDTGTGAIGSPKKFISSGVALLSGLGGDTLNIQPGTYSNVLDAITSVPTGAPAAYNTIRAVTDGTVIITGVDPVSGFSLSLPLGNHYTTFIGLRWESATEKDINGNFVKFFRCGFKGGPATGNTVNVSIGTNNATPGATFILLEDCWAYGPGGRYKVIVYNSDSVILRRVVVRHDGGWTWDGSNPQAGIAFYDSKNVRGQDIMVIDSLTGLTQYLANIYIIVNNTTTLVPTNLKIQGAIVLNGDGNGIGEDAFNAWTNLTIDDAFVWLVNPVSLGDGITFNPGAPGGVANNSIWNRIFVHGPNQGFSDYTSTPPTSTVKNSIAYQNTADAIHFVGTATDIVSWQNGTDFGTVLNPTTNGEMYPPRIEAGSVLSTLGAGGTQIGPQIVKQLGTSGTLYGDVPG